jgi:hypothetical protein
MGGELLAQAGGNRVVVAGAGFAVNDDGNRVQGVLQEGLAAGGAAPLQG